MLDFHVYPCQLGELKFSDGNRLMGFGDSPDWSELQTIGDLSRELKKLGYKDIDEAKFWPMSTTISVTDEDPKRHHLLKDEAFTCGLAKYQNNEYAKGLNIWLCVEKEVFRDLLQARLDIFNGATFDISIRGLDDDDGHFSGTWDLDDKSDCGEGQSRVVTRFSFERETRHFPRDIQAERAISERANNIQQIEKIRSLMTEVLAIQNGTVDGPLHKLLRLNLLAASVIVAIGILALARLYF